MTDPEIDYDNPIIDVLLAEEREPDWLIPNVILSGTLVCWAGAPAAGKSSACYTVAMALASGVSGFSGIIPSGEPTTVVYFDQENSPQNRDKYIRQAWHGLVDSHGVKPDEGLLLDHFKPVHFRLGQKDWLARAIPFVERFRPKVCFFDTAASVFGITDENSNAEAAHVVGEVRALMANTNPMMTAIVLKHARSTPDENGNYRMRGATMWQSLVDQTIFHLKMPGRPRGSAIRRRGRGALNLTRLKPDKTRAFGLDSEIYLTPSYTDEACTGMVIEASYTKSAEHKKALARERGGQDEDDDE